MGGISQTNIQTSPSSSTEIKPKTILPEPTLAALTDRVNNIGIYYFPKNADQSSAAKDSGTVIFTPHLCSAEELGGREIVSYGALHHALVRKLLTQQPELVFDENLPFPVEDLNDPQLTEKLHNAGSLIDPETFASLFPGEDTRTIKTTLDSLFPDHQLPQVLSPAQKTALALLPPSIVYKCFHDSAEITPTAPAFTSGVKDFEADIESVIRGTLASTTTRLDKQPRSTAEANAETEKRLVIDNIIASLQNHGRKGFAVISTDHGLKGDLASQLKLVSLDSSKDEIQISKGNFQGLNDYIALDARLAQELSSYPELQRIAVNRTSAIPTLAFLQLTDPEAQLSAIGKLNPNKDAAALGLGLSTEQYYALLKAIMPDPRVKEALEALSPGIDMNPDKIGGTGFFVRSLIQQNANALQQNPANIFPIAARFSSTLLDITTLAGRTLLPDAARPYFSAIIGNFVGHANQVITNEANLIPRLISDAANLGKDPTAASYDILSHTASGIISPFA